MVRNICEIRGLHDEDEDKNGAYLSNAAKHGERRCTTKSKQSTPLPSAYSLARHKLKPLVPHVELVIHMTFGIFFVLLELEIMNERCHLF